MHTELTNRERFLWTVLVLAVWAIPLVVLGILDLFLARFQLETISRYVWGGWGNQPSHDWLGWIIVAWTCLGPLFLAGHFFFGWFRPPDPVRRVMRGMP